MTGAGEHRGDGTAHQAPGQVRLQHGGNIMDENSVFMGLYMLGRGFINVNIYIQCNTL